MQLFCHGMSSAVTSFVCQGALETSIIYLFTYCCASVRARRRGGSGPWLQVKEGERGGGAGLGWGGVLIDFMGEGG